MPSPYNSTNTSSAMHNPDEDATCQSELINLSLDKPPRSSSLHPLALPAVTPLIHNNIDAPSPPKLKLTLSAYHRSENTVRLTDACPTKLIHSEYELLDPSCCHTLGHGASSTVQLAYHRRTGKPVAVKTIAKHDALGLCSKNRYRDGSRKVPRLEEVDVLSLMRGCDNVIELLDVYETNTEVQLVLEYCEGGDLFDCIKRRRHRRLLDPSLMEYPGNFREGEVARVAKTLLGVLKTMHENHCIHRDVKPENILLVKPDEDGSLLDVKLTDFGLAKILHQETDDACFTDASESNASSDNDRTLRKQRSRAYSRVGSDFYTAPEVNIGLGYDTPVDIYSLGVTLYVMLCGTPPSLSQLINDPIDKIEDQARSSCITTEDSCSDSEESNPSTPTAMADLFPTELNISPLAQDFVCKLINPNNEQRVTALDALQHEWITQFEGDDVASGASPFSKTRSMSVSEAKAFLKLPIQGSLHEIAPLVLPPSNSPKLTPTPTPPPVSVTLANVCTKLVPFLDGQRHHNKNHRRYKSSPRKHSRSLDKARIVTSTATPPKKIRMEQQPSSSISSDKITRDPGTCGRIRIIGHG